MILTPGKWDKYLVFSEDFRNREAIQSRGGVIVACQNVGNGISPSGVSGRVTFAGTENVGSNATKMTWVFRVRTGTAPSSLTRLLWKGNPGDYSWSLDIGTGDKFNTYLGPGFPNFFTCDTVLSPLTEYTLGAAYDGTWGAATRVVHYVNGQPTTSTRSGTLPTSILSNAKPLSVYNFYGGAGEGLANGQRLRAIRVFQGTAWGAQEFLDDYNANAFSKLSVGGGA